MKLLSVFSNERGVSLLEGLIGIGSVAGLAAFIATMTTNQNNKDLTYKRACESMANSAIDAITDEVAFLEITHVTPSSTLSELDATMGSSLYSGCINDNNCSSTNPDIPEVLNSDLWGGVVTIVSGVVPGMPPTIRNNKLIQGSMSALNAMHNQVAMNMCTGYRFYEPMSVDNLGINNELLRADTASDPLILVSLAPLDSNKNIDCTKPRQIVPPSGIAANQYAFDGTSYTSATGTNGLAILPADARSDYSYLLGIQVSYSYDGQTYNCAVEKEFAYPNDSQPPSWGNLSVTITSNPSRQVTHADNTSCDPLNPAGIGAAARYDTSVVISYDNLEPGSLLFCRDISQQMVFNDGLTESGSAPLCMAADDSPGTWDRVAPTSVRDSFSEAGVAPNHDRWYPCHQLPICANDVVGAPINPNDAVVTGAGSPAEFTDASGPVTLSLSYSNVLPSCVAGVQVIAVDSSGNVSEPVANNTSFPVNPGSIEYLTDIDPNISPHFDTTVIVTLGGTGITISPGLGAGIQDKRVFHRPWCGGNATIANGISNDYGVLCLPSPPGVTVSAGDPYTDSWVDKPFAGPSTDTITFSGQPVGSNFARNNNSDWNDDFPNGYYTCRPSGCCYNNANCTPFADEATVPNGP